HHVQIHAAATNRDVEETGFDVPDKECPICGTMMKKDGVNIPFETFLGVEGGKPKEPDIDLNFSGEYQSRAHEKTKDLFGDDYTFKAGTVSTVAKETSYSYIKKYNKDNNIVSKDTDIEYQKTGITDCKKSTGQHPGGMVVVPNDEYIYTFTPIQYPAKKEENGKTTHFEYHEIEENLLKLDILGQDGPTFMKKLKDLTGVDPMEVPFYDEKVISLFKNLSSIGLSKSDIHGETLGCLSIPEFGTSATMKMCKEASPKSVADLIRISGLAHGTDVWVGNIRDIVLKKIAPIDECVCCRDDIMIYLNERGIENTLSFEIMESVRKGKRLKPEWEEKMRDKGVPEWYIECCNKIKYMFPKAHAAAYVTTSLRVGYYKIYYPIEYYTVFFSIKLLYSGGVR
ncbi:MAG: PolC-type DNA polymerase III, partial [Lachnospiraceae bacterium]|nr:PolC-type DNA polymerase III [Lachnospiraceae bacterium]